MHWFILKLLVKFIFKGRSQDDLGNRIFFLNVKNISPNINKAFIFPNTIPNYLAIYLLSHFHWTYFSASAVGGRRNLFTLWCQGGCRNWCLFEIWWGNKVNIFFFRALHSSQVNNQQFIFRQCQNIEKIEECWSRNYLHMIQDTCKCIPFPIR